MIVSQVRLYSHDALGIRTTAQPQAASPTAGLVPDFQPPRTAKLHVSEPAVSDWDAEAVVVIQRRRVPEQSDKQRQQPASHGKRPARQPAALDEQHLRYER